MIVALRPRRVATSAELQTSFNEFSEKSSAKYLRTVAICGTYLLGKHPALKSLCKFIFLRNSLGKKYFH